MFLAQAVLSGGEEAYVQDNPKVMYLPQHAKVIVQSLQEDTTFSDVGDICQGNQQIGTIAIVLVGNETYSQNANSTEGAAKQQQKATKLTECQAKRDKLKKTVLPEPIDDPQKVVHMWKHRLAYRGNSTYDVGIRIVRLSNYLLEIIFPCNKQAAAEVLDVDTQEKIGLISGGSTCNVDWMVVIATPNEFIPVQFAGTTFTRLRKIGNKRWKDGATKMPISQFLRLLKASQNQTASPEPPGYANLVSAIERVRNNLHNSLECLDKVYKLLKECPDKYQEVYHWFQCYTQQQFYQRSHQQIQLPSFQQILPQAEYLEPHPSLVHTPYPVPAQRTETTDEDNFNFNNNSFAQETQHTEVHPQMKRLREESPNQITPKRRAFSPFVASKPAESD